MLKRGSGFTEGVADSIFSNLVTLSVAALEAFSG